VIRRRKKNEAKNLFCNQSKFKSAPWTFVDLTFCGFALMKSKRGFAFLCRKIEIINRICKFAN
jgi:hypothetical protein